MSQGERRDRTVTMQVRIPVPEPDPEHTPVLQACLTVLRGQGADLGRIHAIELEALIGRAPDAELRLTDPGVSWRHARVWCEPDGRHWLEDLGSTNGTRMRSRTLRGKIVLKEGDKILLGATILRFGLVDSLELGFQREVAQLATTDPLSGLEAKRCFDDALDAALASARQYGASLALLMMDMDGIKAINDAHGHLFGAHCIGEAGRIIGRVVGGVGRACRFGGDEFMAFVPGYDAAAALQLGERIRAAIDGAGMHRDGVALHPTLSIGAACFPDDGDEAGELTAAADSALYRAKAQGKNRVSL
jgi:two-component system, cell cycle response regulator